MTYGPALKWSQLLGETIDLRKKRIHTFFICLSLVAIVSVFVLYYVSHPLSRQTTFENGGKFKFSKNLVNRKQLLNRNISTSNEDSESDASIEYGNGDEYSDDDGDETLINSTDVSSNLTARNASGAELQTVFWNDTRLDILHMPKLQFDTMFKNPCWFESLDTWDPYEGNVYASFSPSARRTLERMSDHWEEVYDTEVNPVRLRCVPYFMIIGQPKCGSTDLFWKVSKHPNIGTPPIKELHWWSRSRQGRRFSYTKIIPFRDYVDMFDSVALKLMDQLDNGTSLDNETEVVAPPFQDQLVTGEASVSLFWDNNDWMKYPENVNQMEPQYIVPHYIHHLVPSVKLILILREPTSRMYSDYLYFNTVNKSADEFHSLVKVAISEFNACFKERGLRACVYDSRLYNRLKLRLQVGLYSVFMTDWLQVFPREQFYIVRLEDYSKDNVRHIRQIYEFLNLRELTLEEEHLISHSPKSNVRTEADKKLGGMHDETRALLEEFYSPFNKQLAQMLEDSKFLWSDVR